MPYIESTKFGEITIDGRKYGQVLLIGDLVLEREAMRLEEVFGTTHRIGDWETEQLLHDKPQVVIVGTGQNGILQVDEKFLQRMQGSGVEVIVNITPQAIKIYSEKVNQGERVNALMHTTC